MPRITCLKSCVYYSGLNSSLRSLAACREWHDEQYTLELFKALLELVTRLHGGTLLSFLGMEGGVIPGLGKHDDKQPAVVAANARSAIMGNLVLQLLRNTLCSWAVEHSRTLALLRSDWESLEECKA